MIDRPLSVAAGHGLLPTDSSAIPPVGLALAPRRGRLRNGAAPGDFLAAPRCGARTRAGGSCCQPAMKNGRCRLHGGMSTGPRTPAGRTRCAAARRTHGLYAAETIALRRAAATQLRRMRPLLAMFKARPTAGHGVLPSRSAAPAPRPTTNSIGVHRRASAAKTPSTAGHGLLPSFPASALAAARPVHRPARRQGLVQRCLMGSSALGLGLTVAPPVTAGHGVLPSFSVVPPQRPARYAGRAFG